MRSTGGKGNQPLVSDTVSGPNLRAREPGNRQTSPLNRFFNRPLLPRPPLSRPAPASRPLQRILALYPHAQRRYQARTASPRGPGAGGCISDAAPMRTPDAPGRVGLDPVEPARQRGREVEDGWSSCMSLERRLGRGGECGI